jgi:hypothetical protein
MARRTKTGKFIVSAGEVGQFVYCQESWRIRESQKKPETQSSESIKGEISHKQWADNLSNASHLAEGLRFILALVVTTVVIVIAY